MKNSQNIQWLSEKDGPIGVFRYGPEFHNYGDPYEISFIVQKLHDGGLHIFGAQSMLKQKLLGNLKNIKKIIKKEGVKYVFWERLKEDGVMKKVKIK